MTQFRDAAHVNTARLAVALAERGYLSPDQAAQMCDGKVSLQNYSQAREALRGALNNSDGNSAYLAQLLGQQLGISLRVQVQAERMGYTPRGETVREGQGDAMRDMFSSAIERATAQSNGGIANDGCFGNGGINDGVDNGGFNNGALNNNGAFNNGGVESGCDYNSCGSASTSPLAALAAFAVGGLIGSQIARRNNNNNWNDQWGNGWMNRVPRQRVIVERVVERNPVVPTFQAPQRHSPPISRPTNDRVLRPPPSITQRPPPVSRPPPQRENPPVQQRHPHDPVRSPSTDPHRTRH